MLNYAASVRPPRRMFLVVTAVLALIICDGGPGAEACSPPEGWKPPTDIELMINAAVVLYGRVQSVYPDSSETTVYTANIEVYCIMKGNRTEQFVNISEAGVCINQLAGHFGSGVGFRVANRPGLAWKVLELAHCVHCPVSRQVDSVPEFFTKISQNLHITSSQREKSS